MEKIDNCYRGLPFWSLNGELELDEAIRQVHVMKEMGFGGFFMHSRTGLKTEYLGDKWFEIINACAVEAEKIGMNVWLYDEDRWPSGTCGGEVTKNPLFRCKSISMYDSECDKDEFQSNIISFAVKFSSEEKIIDYYELSKNEKPKDGYIFKTIYVEEMAKQDFYNGYTYLDTLNYDATQAFIASTHKKYKEKCGDKFGKTILGIFQDEPHRGVLLNDFGKNNENRMNMLPYTYTLFDEFKKKRGYDLREKLIELYYLLDGKNINKVMYDYIEVLQEMFIDNFTKPYQKWCNENKLIVTGHVLHEDSLSIQTMFQGSCQRYYEYMDYPGVDILTEGNNAYWVAKQVQSVARQLGKPFVLSELYGCSGWQMNFESHRDVGAWQALFGINMRCHHLSWYTMEGESKRDYPASILHQSGWYKNYSYIEDYFARAGKILSSGKPLVKTLVISPLESVWLYPRKGWVKNTFTPTVKEIIDIEQNYFKLFDTLTKHQVDFDYCDEDILARYNKIENINGEPSLIVGEQAYTEITLSSNHTLRNSTLTILEKFIACGGKVYCVDEKPKYIDGVETANILPEVKSVSMDNICAKLTDGKIFTATGNLLSTVRCLDDGYYIILLNSDRKNGVDSEITFNEDFSVKEIRLENGENIPLYSMTNKFSSHFHKGEMRAFHITHNSIALDAKNTQIEALSEISLTDNMEYDLNEDNVLPLDMPAFTFRNVSYAEDEILQVDRKVRDIFGIKYRGGEMIQPWYKDKYLQLERKPCEQLILTNAFYIDAIPKELTLAMEQSEKYIVKLNDTVIPTTTNSHWIDVCFDKIKLDTSLLHIGKNTMSFTVNFDEDINLETAYLLGNFGVLVDNNTKKTITALPKTLGIGDITNQGLPFYSGSVTYKTKIHDAKVKVNVRECNGAFTFVNSENNKQIIAFDPYETTIFNATNNISIEVVLTRRNTFGPLHLIGINADAYGPGHFVNSDLYMKQYSLIAQGLLLPPKVTFYK